MAKVQHISLFNQPSKRKQCRKWPHPFLQVIRGSQGHSWGIHSSGMWHYITGWLVPSVPRQCNGHQFQGWKRTWTWPLNM